MTEKFAKKLLGENDVEAVLKRLDRLTREELQKTATQTLEIVYDLFKNMSVVMDGTETLLEIMYTICLQSALLDGKASINNIQATLGMVSSYLEKSITHRGCQS